MHSKTRILIVEDEVTIGLAVKLQVQLLNPDFAVERFSGSERLKGQLVCAERIRMLYAFRDLMLPGWLLSTPRTPVIVRLESSSDAVLFYLLVDFR